MEQKKPMPKSILRFSRLDVIDVDAIEPSEYNPREQISKEEVSDIRESIQEMGGILVPIVVYQKNSKYVLLDGERRWRAARQLAEKDPHFKKIPANVIERPLNEIDDVLTMFNIHMKRKQWSTAALIEALGKLQKVDKEIDLHSSKFAHKIGLTSTSLSDARKFLLAPEDIRQRCVDGDLNEYVPIFVERAIEACERTFPEVVEEYDREDLMRKMIRKVDEGWVKEAKSFTSLSKVAAKCLAYRQKRLFKKIFQKLVDQVDFTLEEAMRIVDQELKYKEDEEVFRESKSFLSVVSSYLREHKDDIPQNIHSVLLKILSELQRLKQ